MNNITNLKESSNQNIIDQIKEIFFLSSSVKNFKDDEHKNNFFMRWCGDYIKYYPETFYIYTDTKGQVLGYLSGCNNTYDSLTKLNVPAQELFKDQYDNFPAHLHINFHPDSRGMGLGSLLVNYYTNELIKLNIKGLYLVTSPDARNVHFYDKLEFSFHLLRQFNNSDLFFMGRILK